VMLVLAYRLPEDVALPSDYGSKLFWPVVKEPLIVEPIELLAPRQRRREDRIRKRDAKKGVRKGLNDVM